MVVTRRTVVFGGAVVAAGLAFGRCGSGVGKPLARWRPQTLEVWGGPSADQRRAQLEAWMARHPHLKVSFRVAEATGAGVESLRKFAAATAGGKAPHVVDFDRFQMATYALWRLFRPIDEHARRDKYDLGRFAPAVLAEARGFDRQLYGLPSSVDIRLLYWNKELFERAGLDPERPPATWDELRAAAARVTRPGGRTGLERLGFHTTEGQASLHTFAWQSGGSFQSPDGRTATLPLAPNQEALEWLVQLTNDLGGWRAGAAFRDAWGKGAQHPFLTGQLAMHYQLDGWAGDHVARHRPDLAFGVAPLPARRAGDPPFSWSGGYSYVICRDTRHLDLAWELIKWLVSEPGWTVAYDGDLARARALGGVYLPGMTGQPALDRRMHEKYRTGVPALDRVAELAVDQLPHTRFRELSIAAADLWDGVLRAHVEAVAQIKSPRQALEDNNALVQRALDQAWTFAPK